MKRILILPFMIMIIFAAVAVDAKPGIKPPPAPLGVLYLFQKEPVEVGPWPVVHGGAWGVLKYNLWGKKFNFDFHGRNLASRTNYTLIYYPDPWPGEGLICLGSGKSTPSGNLNIHDHNFDIGTSLPKPGEENDANWKAWYPSGAVGAKIWLVLSSDVNCGENSPQQMTGWNPDDYLFEYNLIIFELKN